MTNALLASSTSTTQLTPTELFRGVLSGAGKGLFDAFLAEWRLWVAILLFVAAMGAYRLYRLRRLARSGIAQVDQMEGRRFEEFLATVFRRLGYRAELTPYVGDYGADLVVTKNGVRQAVQAKRSKKAVGPKAVQEVAAARRYYNCQGALVVTNAAFTAAAKRLARANDVGLWGRDDLVAKLLILQHQGEQAGSTTWAQPLAQPPSPQLQEALDSQALEQHRNGKRR